MTKPDAQQQLEALGPWFYEFDLPNIGHTRSVVPPEVTKIFDTRLEMVSRVVDAHFGSRLPEISCIDVGCHEGFYSLAMSRKGVRQVRSIDFRESNIKKARFVAEAFGIRNIEYRQGDAEHLSPETVGQHELCLFLGLLYHLENPMLCLRNIAAITKEVCIVETQVIDEVEGVTEWGARIWKHPYQGVLALIDETHEYNSNNTETGSTPIVTCPSPKALETMLKHAGFRRVEIIAPPPDAYEQHARGKRVVCAAYK